jgi:hypothetical protein
MLFLNLNCGRCVALTNFAYSLTYGGLIMGRPNPKVNAMIVESAISQCERSWGKRALHLIPPTVDQSDPAHPMLPPILLRAWLSCNKPANSAFMGSQLVVVWFTEECDSEPIADIVSRAVRDLPWEQLAGDFDY